MKKGRTEKLNTSSQIKELTIMAKRKAEYDAAEKNNKTPRKNLAEQKDFSAEFAQEENPAKAKNRNSKHGREGRMNDER